MFEVSDAYKTAIAKQSRRFKLSGEIRLKSGTAVDITDSNVIGELSVSTQMMSGSRYDDTIDIGAITSAVLSMALRDDSSANSFADARVRLLVGLELEDGTYEYVKMGIFYIDSPSIQRVKNIISFTAYDKMIFLNYLLTDTMRSNMSGMDAYGAAGYLCSLVGIQLQQTHDEVAAFPNGDIALSFTSESMETARDVIMWCGQLMGCFSRITRSGKLEFVQIKAENSATTGVIIPVREIQSSQRYSTKFADEVLRISTLTMKKPDGKIARAYLSGITENKRSLELELEQNPLLTGQSVKSVSSALKDILTVLKTAYFRPFTSEIANDPALDAGDYVRLRGGSIDTARGYATGMITHSLWHYRGKQEIVNVGSTPVLSQLEDDTADMAAVIALSAETDEGEESGDISGEEVVYTQPKAQSEKYAAGLDSVTAQKLQSNNAAGYVTTDDYGAVIGTSKGGIKIHSTNSAAVLNLPETSNFMKAPVTLTNYNNGLKIDGTKILVQSGNTLLIVKGDFEVSDTQILLVSSNGNLIIGKTANGFFINGNNNILEAKSDGLYYNNQKVLLESS